MKTLAALFAEAREKVAVQADGSKDVLALRAAVREGWEDAAKCNQWWSLIQTKQALPSELAGVSEAELREATELWIVKHEQRPLASPREAYGDEHEFILTSSAGESWHATTALLMQDEAYAVKSTSLGGVCRVRDVYVVYGKYTGNLRNPLLYDSTLPAAAFTLLEHSVKKTRDGTRVYGHCRLHLAVETPAGQLRTLAMDLTARRHSMVDKDVVVWHDDLPDPGVRYVAESIQAVRLAQPKLTSMLRGQLRSLQVSNKAQQVSQYAVPTAEEFVWFRKGDVDEQGMATQSAYWLLPAGKRPITALGACLDRRTIAAHVGALFGHVQREEYTTFKSRLPVVAYFNGKAADKQLVEHNEHSMEIVCAQFDCDVVLQFV